MDKFIDKDIITGAFKEKANKKHSKNELIELLQTYKGILNNSMIDYLHSLIELEFSVVREYISDTDRKVLSELEVYKAVAIYNICNRAMNLLSSENTPSNIYINTQNPEKLNITAKLDAKIIDLFNFNYSEGTVAWNETIPSGYKTMQIGKIELYQTLESQELREKELNRVIKILEHLYDAKNPYSSFGNAVGGPSTDWYFEHQKQIEYYEEKFEELDNKKELSETDKKEIELTNYIHNLFLKDYGLTNKYFDKEITTPTSSMREKTGLRKTLVKKMPNLEIKTNIKYL